MTVATQARRIASAVPADLRAQLQQSPLDALIEAGLSVGELPGHSESTRWCDGLSMTDEGIVLYIATPDSRRENFTLLHEYAHYLVEADGTAMNWVADQPDDRRVLEQLCNAVASTLLVPADVVDETVGTGPIEAQHLLTLHQKTEASQVVIAIALACRLGTTGAVILVDRSRHTVAAAALAGDLNVWPWKDQAVPDTHPLRRIEPRTHLRTRSWWATPWGERQTFYLDAVATDRRAYAILTVTDVWGIDTFHGGDADPERVTRPSSERKCSCGYHGRMGGFPCPTCGANFCPKCQECLCTARDSKLVRCNNCTVSYSANDIVDGRCSNCR